MRIRTSVRAGSISHNHNAVRRGKKLVVKTGVRAGALSHNHNAIVR
jgi:hypothetical protein